MAKINIREGLNKLDVRSNNKYDLRNLYDSMHIADDDKKHLSNMLKESVSASKVHDYLIGLLEGIEEDSTPSLDEQAMTRSDALEEKEVVKVGAEIPYDQAKRFYDRGYIDILVTNDKGETRTIKGFHGAEAQRKVGDKANIEPFDKVVDGIKKELGDNVKFTTVNPETNKTYQNEIEDDGDNTHKVTGKAYKLFKVVKGKLYPPMIKNPSGESTPIGKWIKCGASEFDELSASWGKPQARNNQLAYRPGWHLGELPYAPQFESKKDPGYFSHDNFVWGLCEYDAEVDYQDRAMSYGFSKDGKFTNSAAGLPYKPDHGYYKYRTNPNPNTIAWVITGAMKVVKILSDDEVEKICAENNVPFLKRKSGNKTLAELGLKESISKDWIWDGYGDGKYRVVYLPKDAECDVYSDWRHKGRFVLDRVDGKRVEKGNLTKAEVKAEILNALGLKESIGDGIGKYYDNEEVYKTATTVVKKDTVGNYTVFDKTPKGMVAIKEISWRDKNAEAKAKRIADAINAENSDGLDEAKRKPSDPAKLKRAEDAMFDSLMNGATSTEQMIQEAKFIYGITYDEAKEAFYKANNRFMAKTWKDDEEDDGWASYILKKNESYDIKVDNGVNVSTEKYDTKDEADKRYDELNKLKEKPSMKGLGVEKEYDESLKESVVTFSYGDDKVGYTTDKEIQKVLDNRENDYIWFTNNKEDIKDGKVLFGNTLQLAEIKDIKDNPTIMKRIKEEGLMKESLDISSYEELNGVSFGGKAYRLFRKRGENGEKSKWAVIPQSMGEDDGEPFEITYAQARGVEPINDNQRLGLAVGKALKLGDKEINENGNRTKDDPWGLLH